MKTKILRLQSVGLAVLFGATAGATASNEVSQPATHPPSSSSATASTQNSSSNAPAFNDLSMSRKPAVSPWSAQVLKLARAGVDEQVVLSYIDSAGTFNLTAEQIISLTESGVPQDVITAMIQHDAEIHSGMRQVLPITVPTSDDDTLSTMLPPLKVAAAAKPQSSPPTSVPYSAPPDESLAAPADFPTEYILAPLEENYLPAEMQERSPVRKPYPVQLTAPILVWPTAGRIPNVVLVHSFP